MTLNIFLALGMLTLTSQPVSQPYSSANVAEITLAINSACYDSEIGERCGNDEPARYASVTLDGECGELKEALNIVFNELPYKIQATFHTNNSCYGTVLCTDSTCSESKYDVYLNIF